MLLRKLFKVSLLLALLTFTLTNYAAEPFYEGAEHILMGDQVKSPFPLLHLPNGLSLTYGRILILGDFYEVSEQPIMAANSTAEKRARFLAAFDSFAKNLDVVGEVAQILAVIQAEQDTIAAGVKDGMKPEDVYKKISPDVNRQLNCVTGGGCDEAWWLQPGRYLILASTALDHFGENAYAAYQIGHQLALEVAQNARQTHNQAQLEIAYAMNAFASHFLSDRFSSGHIRTPYEKLTTAVTPSVIGSLLVKYMHNEENAYGVHVHNQRGDAWVAYGDDYYLSENNAAARLVLQEALQVSADEILSVYNNGITNQIDKAIELLPQADETGAQGNRDVAPLFYWDEATQTIMRRVVTKDIYDRNWTSNWWGWSTYVQLSRERGMPTGAQATLALSGNGRVAMQYGLITEPAVVKYVNAHA